MSKYLCDNAYEILQNNPESALLLNSIRSTYYILAQALEGRNCFKDKLDALASISSSVNLSAQGLRRLCKLGLDL
ncbi:hypothetical protein DYL72_15960 [Vibrio anguillarum]|uniref:Uncharacterized protein n=1 Tax=Vibrio anguillarum TaxID=55601 RepID=A0A7U6FS96_VIBAN|nr:hypothetical protein [Vibrio anguillarum]AZS26398.1 hypothetical protein DYL72_15960 [Vibrio anguillarum]